MGWGGYDQLYGSYGNDLLEGGDGSDGLQGDFGNDTLSGDGGDDYLSGGDGNDVLRGGDGNDYMYGSGGNDVLQGGDGNDYLYDFEGFNICDGGAGNDTLSCGSSQITLTGGSGRDTFSINSLYAPSADTITDFTAGAAGDILDYRNLMSQLTGYTGDNPFASGYMRFVQSGTDTLFQVDSDGTAGGAAFQTVVIMNNVTASSLETDNFLPGFDPLLV